MSPVKYELGFISQKTAFFIVTAVKTSNLIYLYMLRVYYKITEQYQILADGAGLT
jgi:hypothetical protein